MSISPKKLAKRITSELLSECKHEISLMDKKQIRELQVMTGHLRGDVGTLAERLAICKLQEQGFQQSNELYYCYLAHLKYGGQREVAIDYVGRIDLLLNLDGVNYMVEAKNWRGWKSALGQIIAYNASYNGGDHCYSMALALIGNIPRGYLSHINRILKGLDVALLSLASDGSLTIDQGG